MAACSCCGSLVGLVLGLRGALRKDFFFFLEAFFFWWRVLVVGPFLGLFWGPGPRFSFSFLPPFFLGLVFFFCVFLFFFFALGAGRRAVLFSPSLFGACFSFVFFFGVFFVVFSSPRGLFFLWVFLWASFGTPGGSKKGFFFWGAFFLGGRVLFVGPFLGLFWDPGGL